MTTPRVTRSPWRRILFTALILFTVVAAFTIGPELKLGAYGSKVGAYSHRESGEANDSLAAARLTPVLADLARSVPQRSAGAVAERTGRVTPLTLDAMPKAARDATVARLMRIDANNAVQVYVHVQEVNADNLQALAAAGVTIEIADPPGRRVQARIPASRLQAVAALPFVTFVGLPTYARFRTGSVTSEGDAILHSSAARSQFGVDGTGIKVGVLSDGIKGVFATGCQTCSGIANGPIAKGDLPSATGTRQATGIGTYGVLLSSSGGITGQSFVTGDNTYYGPKAGDLEGTLTNCSDTPFAGSEGTALLEIVHDIAPNAQLSFANFDTDIAFNQAVNALAASNDVVIDDIGFYGYPADGTSSVSANTAAALNNPSNRIRAYITAVGNAADEHYFGNYLASSVDGATISGITNHGRLHEFQQGSDTTDVLGLGRQPYNLIKLPNGGVVVIYLTWNDPWGASTNNYDLYLVDETTGAVVRKGEPANTPSDPAEGIAYQNLTGSTRNFHIVVQNVNDQAAARELNIFSYQPQCAASGPAILKPGRHERHNYNTATRSVSAQNDAGGSPVSVISAGAICSASSQTQSVPFAVPDESCFDATNSTAEFFSSRGPTLDGRTKPDIAGIDGVSVTGAAGFPNPFFGTSAAAPHIAGIAALALQTAPCLVSGGNGAIDPAAARARLRNLLVGNAAGLGDPNTFGSGRADAQATVQAALPAYAGSSTLTVPGTSMAGATVTASQLGFSDPNQCPLGNLKWTGGCGTSPGSTLTCPLGATNVSVSATNNGVAYSSPVNVQIVVTSFSLAGTPGSATVNAGQSAVYQVTVASQSGAFPANVTLGCANLPANASCSFNPATVTPGATSAHSTLTITTKAPAIAAAGGVSHPASWDHPAPIALLLTIAIAFTLPSRSRRRVAAMAALSVAAAFVLAQFACGSNPSPKPPTPAPAVSLSPSSLSFASQYVQTTSAAQTITLTNTGNAALSISTIAASGDFAQTNTCASSLAASANCSIAVTFTPTAAGQRTGAISIADNAAGSPHTVALTGTAQPANGTPVGTYTVSITGTSGTLVQAGSVSLVVH